MLELIGFDGKIKIEELPDDSEILHWAVAVTVNSRGLSESYLSGSHNDIYILRSNFETFLIDLETLERRRLGEASLISTDPDGFKLTFCNVDILGHMMVEGQLTHYTYLGFHYKYYLHKLNFAFEFDPSHMPRLVKEFSKLKTGKS